MADKIVAFPGAEPLPENPLTIKQERYSFCSHESVSLDHHLRTVNCLKCGAVLDPFNFLLNNAKTLQMAWQNHRVVTGKITELHERVESLTKEHLRLSRQVKRLQEKAAPVLDVRGKESL